MMMMILTCGWCELLEVSTRHIPPIEVLVLKYIRQLSEKDYSELHCFFCLFIEKIEWENNLLTLTTEVVPEDASAADIIK